MNNITYNPPPLKTKVILYRRDPIDCGYIEKWKSTGWRVKDNTYSVRMVDGLTFDILQPTHWEPLP